jgi:hypothetical protein
MISPASSGFDAMKCKIVTTFQAALPCADSLENRNSKEL